jgi:hypothetical protein
MSAVLFSMGPAPRAWDMGHAPRTWVSVPWFLKNGHEPSHRPPRFQSRPWLCCGGDVSVASGYCIAYTAMSTPPSFLDSRYVCVFWVVVQPYLRFFLSRNGRHVLRHVLRRVCHVLRTPPCAGPTAMCWYIVLTQVCGQVWHSGGTRNPRTPLAFKSYIGLTFLLADVTARCCC